MIQRTLTLTLTAALVVALAPLASATPKTTPPGLLEDAGIGNVRGSNLTLELVVTAFNKDTGRGTIKFTTFGGSWFFRPEIGDEASDATGTASFVVRSNRSALPYMKLGDIRGELHLVGGKDKVEFSRALFTLPGERGFYIDDIIIGVNRTYTGVNGLLLPAVQ